MLKLVTKQKKQQKKEKENNENNATATASNDNAAASSSSAAPAADTAAQNTTSPAGNNNTVQTLDIPMPSPADTNQTILDATLPEPESVNVSLPTRPVNVEEIFEESTVVVPSYTLLPTKVTFLTVTSNVPEESEQFDARPELSAKASVPNVIAFPVPTATQDNGSSAT